VLCAVGDLIEDVVVQLHDHIRPDTDTPATIVRRRGGSAANVAYIAAKLTGQSRFVGCVGVDPLGDSLVERLSTHGVQVCGERKGRTGSIVIVATSDGVRTMLTDRGASTELSSWSDEWIRGVSVMHAPLYSFSHDPLATITHTALHSARTHGAITSLDLSSVALIDHIGVDVVRTLLSKIAPDVVFCTRAEADAVGVTAISMHGARLVVVKDGERPIRVLSSTDESSTYPVEPVDSVVDGTGAGDAFAAGFLTQMSHGAAIADCIDAARGVAARVVVRAGATLEDE
jgi:sugar/nucleoside kinase (ribokinase family)